MSENTGNREQPWAGAVEIRPQPAGEEQDQPANLHYDSEFGLLWIGNGLDAPGGMDLCPGITVFTSENRMLSGVLIDGAEPLLMPLWVEDWPEYEGDDDQNPEMDYSPEKDILWLGNGEEAHTGRELCPGITVFFTSNNLASGILIERAKKMLLPYLAGEK